MKSELLVVEISLKEPIKKFGHWLVQAMNHSGLSLYLILHPEEIEILCGAKPIGLEVNLPTGIDVYMGRDDLDRGRKKPRIDLIFKKEENYYIVEIIDKKRISMREKAKVEEYAKRFKENLGVTAKFQVVPIIVCPKESPNQAFMELMRQKP